MSNKNNNISQNNLNQTQSKTFQKPIKADASSNSMDIKIRNIIHDYANIDCNDYTYGILSNLKSKKRAMNLDAIDDYEIWKKNYILKILLNKKRVFIIELFQKLKIVKKNLLNKVKKIQKN